jgi:hypothetical protein
MLLGTDPNDIFHNGYWYNRNGRGGPATLEVDASGNTVGIVGADFPLRDSLTLLPSGQPVGITRGLKNAGKVVAGFSTGVWAGAGTLVLTQGYSGFDVAGNTTGVRSKTAQPEMLKVVVTDNSAVDMTMVAPASDLLTPMLAGKLGLWVYVESQPGYQPAGTPAGIINITVTTHPSKFSNNALILSFNSNQTREGWNFLKFVQRNPNAYVQGTADTEYHPFGLSAACYGTGLYANIKDTAVTDIKVGVQGFGGATLYFDSLWTAFDSKAQVVLGCDSTGSDLITHALPIFKDYNWIGYTAIPNRIWSSGSKLVNDWTSVAVNARVMYDAGWENINHSTNHLQTGSLTSASEIDYEISAVNSMYANAHMTRGIEFYASPQSNTSRLSEKVIAGTGIKLQRHARKFNVSTTQFGVDNINHVGAIDMGSAASAGISYSNGQVAGSIAGWQIFSKLQRFIDVLIDYGDTGFPFWHGITTLGDSGSGENLTGDNLLITKSAIVKFFEYIRLKEIQGLLRVCDGITGFYYGSGK